MQSKWLTTRTIEFQIFRSLLRDTRKKMAWDKNKVTKSSTITNTSKQTIKETATKFYTVLNMFEMFKF